MAQHYDLLPRSSFDADDNEVKDRSKPPRRCPSLGSLLRKSRRLCRPFYILLGLLFFLAWQVTFNASYANPPPFTIPERESVYIAANIIDGDLIDGAWGRSLEALVESIGVDNVFVSVYGGPTDALQRLEARLKCKTKIVSEVNDPIDLEHLPHITLPTGEQKIKRIAYLAEVRNRALRPLDTLKTRFDKVLFINDVFFEPDDAARLLWGTNINEDGKAEYKAVCATDFVTSWKYYDTFATRDLEGYSIGVPIYPWFVNEGDAVSRKDVLAGKDAVRVKSCWGGMVAFDARYLQPQRAMYIPDERRSDSSDDFSPAPPPSLPIRFRAEPEAFWDSSECCLIHADIASIQPFSPSTTSHDTSTENDKDNTYIPEDLGIYMNPYVRVTYTASTHSFIHLAKRFERLFALPQAILNILAHMPRHNTRRTETAGEIIHDRVWIPIPPLSNPPSSPSNIENAKPSIEFGSEDSTWQSTDVDYVGSRASAATLAVRELANGWDTRGQYADFERVAGRGGFCGTRALLVLKERAPGDTGGTNWEDLRGTWMPPLEEDRPVQR